MQATPQPTNDVRETQNLIASDKVEGTPVRRSDGEKIGTIERVMIDKRSGQVAYAVMSFGGYMGLGEEYYTLPWGVLKYNTSLDAYELNLNEDQLRGAPRASGGTRRVLRPRMGRARAPLLQCHALLGRFGPHEHRPLIAGSLIHDDRSPGSPGDFFLRCSIETRGPRGFAPAGPCTVTS
jgi:sporulation protein YlmC with PRC-barrel domain